MTNATNFKRVSIMNAAFGNPAGEHTAINVAKVRSQCRNILDEYIELQSALGASAFSLQLLRDAGKAVVYTKDQIDLTETRDALCDIHVFAYGAHHFMGVNADKDIEAVVEGVMTRFVKDESDRVATVALHAKKGVTQVYFEGDFPYMIMKSSVDQPDAPKGKFLKSASYKNTVFPALPA